MLVSFFGKFKESQNSKVKNEKPRMAKKEAISARLLRAAK
jgi:hypothetical protein